MDVGIGSWVTGRALRDPGAVALVDGDTGRRRTYAELHARTSALADALHRRGVHRGDRVALLAHNSPEFLEVLLAAAKLGAITVPVNFRLSADEVRYVLTDSGASALLYSSRLAPLAGAAAGGLGLHAQIELPSAVERDSGRHGEFEELVASGSPDAVERTVAESDIALIMYTSGTTGRAKGAMITHANLLWQSVHSLTLGRGLSRYDVTVTPAPLFHIGGLGVLTLPLLYLGGTTVVVEAFDADRTVALMVAEKATVMFLVPAMWTAVTRSALLDEVDPGTLRFAIAGGAPTPLPTLEFFQRRGWYFTEGFGMTETSPTCSFLAAEHLTTRAGSIGVPVPHLRWRLVDDDDREVDVGEVGELVVQGPNVCAGYWERPVETAEAMRGGWFHTGDLGRRDADGFVTLVDRKKDMVITGGENVYPIEVEQVLLRHPAVEDVAVIGVPDERFGEAVIAVVVRPAASSVDAAELIDGAGLVEWTRDRLAHFKCPRRIEFVDELPRNATGKLLKRELRLAYTGSTAAVAR